MTTAGILTLDSSYYFSSIRFGPLICVYLLEKERNIWFKISDCLSRTLSPWGGLEFTIYSRIIKILIVYLIEV